MADPALSAVITVEQLNHSQWHAHLPGRGGTGVGSYVTVLANALIWGELDGHAVESVALDGTHLLLALQPAAYRVSGGSPWVR
jgi:hypothetical protein